MAHSVEFGGNGVNHLKTVRNEHDKHGKPDKAARDGTSAATRHGQDVKAKGTTNRPPAREKAAKPARGRKSAREQRGVHIESRLTTAGADPLDAVVYERRSSTITNPDGSIVFKMDGAEVPTGWSQLATDILISKYFRKAGLPGDKHKGETSG